MSDLNQGASIEAEHFAAIEDAAQVLESAAAHNRAKGGTVLERTQQDRADRLRIALAALSARRTPAATTGDGELSVEQLLQIVAANTGKRINLSLDDLDRYIAVANAAIAADRAQLAQAEADLKTTRATIRLMDEGKQYRDARIAELESQLAELRAQLAAKGQGEPVAKVIEGQQIRFLANGKNFPKAGTMLYAAPAIAQPAKRKETP